MVSLDKKELTGKFGEWARLSKKDKFMFKNRYKLQKQIVTGQGSSEKGVYLDRKTGNKVFIKIGKDRKLLEREFVSQKLFYDQSRKLRGLGVLVPEPFDVIDMGDRCAILMEYIPRAKSLLNPGISTQVKAYIKVLKFLELASKNLEVASEISLPARSAFYQFLSTPYFLFKNLMSYPSYSREFILSFRRILALSLSWLRLSANYLCHGDINITNIFVSGKKVILVDFARSCFSHKYYNLSQALNSTWHKPEFHNLLWEKIVREFNIKTGEKFLLKSFVLLNLIQRLGKRYENKAQEDFYVSRIKEITLSASLRETNQKLIDVIRKLGYRVSPSLEEDEFGRYHGVVFNTKGKKFFVKAVIGGGSYRYRSLYSEIKVNQYLSRLTKENKIEYRGYRLQIPRVEKVIKEGEILCLISDYVPGNRLLDEPSRDRVEMLLTTLELVSRLSKKTRGYKIDAYLKNYTKINLIFHLPFKLLKAVFLSSFAFPRLIVATRKVLGVLAFGSREYGLVHGDINVSNILINKNTVYLTDWEESGWGITAYNSIAPLCVHWEDKIVRNGLIGRLSDMGLRSQIIPLLAYRALVLFNQNIDRKDKKRIRDLKILKFIESAKS